MRCPQGAGGAAPAAASPDFVAASSGNRVARLLPAFAASDPARDLSRSPATRPFGSMLRPGCRPFDRPCR